LRLTAGITDEPNLKNGADWMDAVPISDVDRLKVARTNAIKLLRLNDAPFNLDPELTLKELEIGGMAGDVYGIGQY
jgi:hypothetical protein